MKKTIKLTESELRHLINESVRKSLKESLYTRDQIGHAIQVVKEAIFETLESLGPRAALISYLIEPDSTTILAKGYYGNEGVFDRAIYNNIIKRPNIENDGNRGYTFLALAELIENGEI